MVLSTLHDLAPDLWILRPVMLRMLAAGLFRASHRLVDRVRPWNYLLAAGDAAPHRRLGPGLQLGARAPLRYRDHAGRHQVEAVEEPGYLRVRAVLLRLACEAVVPAPRLGYLLSLDVGGHLGQGQVAARRHRGLKPADDLVRVIGVHDQVHDGDQHDRHRAAEVQRPRRLAQDPVRLAQVRVDVVDGTGDRAGQQDACVLQDHRVVVDVHDPGAWRHGLRHLVRVVRRGNAGADVEELGDPGLASQEAHDPGEERPVGPDRLDDPRVRGHDRVPRRAVGGEVVLAAEPVIVHAGAVRHAGVNAVPVTGIGAATRVHGPEYTGLLAATRGYSPG